MPIHQCRVAGCQRKARRPGYCFTHNQRVILANGSPLQPDAIIDQAQQLLRDKPYSFGNLSKALGISAEITHHVIQQSGAGLAFSIGRANYYTCMRSDKVRALRCIVEQLKGAELSIGEIATLCDISDSTIERHINLLHRAKIVHVCRWIGAGNHSERFWRLGESDDVKVNYRVKYAKKPDAIRRDALTAALFGDAA